MSLLESMRQGTQSTAMKLVFGAIILVFVFWGVGTGGAPTSATLAEVNGKRITDTMFNKEMRQRRSNITAGLTDDQEAELQREVFQGIIEEEVFFQEAQRLDIEVSDEEIARVVLQQAAFKDNDGKFSTTLYERALTRMGLTRGKFEERLRRDLMAQKLVGLVLNAAPVAEFTARRAFEVDNTKLTVQWVRVPEDALLDDVPVDQAAVDARLAMNEAEVKAAYDADFERLYSRPAKADVSSILLRSDLVGVTPDALARQAAEVRALAAATDDDGFADLARRWSEDLSAVNGGRLGMMADAQLDPPVARAVFATDAGGTTDVVTTSRGLQILRVHARQEAENSPFDDVKGQIARDMVAREQLKKVTEEYAERLLAAWKAADRAPADLIAEQGLQVEESDAVRPSQPILPSVGPNQGLGDALAAVTGPVVLDGIYPIQGGWVVAAVTGFEAADDAMWGIQRDRYLAQARMMEQSAFASAWKDSLLARTQIVRYWNP